MYTRHDRQIQLWAAIGVLVAAYGSYVEYQKHQNAAYQAVCDSPTYSCSKVWDLQQFRCVIAAPLGPFEQSEPSTVLLGAGRLEFHVGYLEFRARWFISCWVLFIEIPPYLYNVGIMYYLLCMFAPYTHLYKYNHEFYLVISILAEVGNWMSGEDS